MFDSVLSTILKNNDIEALKKVKPEFLEPIENDIIEFVEEYYADYSTMPTHDRLTKKNIDWQLYLTNKPLPDPIDDQISELHQSRWRLMFKEATQEVESEYSISGVYNTDILKNILALEPVKTSSNKKFYSLDEVDRQDMYLNSPPDAYPFGLEYIDRNTGGSIPGDYILLAGHTGVGKSTFVAIQAARLYMGGHKILIINKEMPDKQMTQKIDSYLVGMDSMTFRRRTDDDMEAIELQLPRILDAHKTAKSKGGEIIMARSSDVNSARDVEEIVSQYENENGYTFDWIFVDGIYILAESLEWRDVKAMSQRMRMLAKNKNLRLFATTQFQHAKDECMKYHKNDLAYSKTMTDDPTLILAFYRNLPEESRNGMKIMNLSILKNREGPEGDFAGIGQYAIDHGTSSMYDLFSAVYKNENLLDQPIEKRKKDETVSAGTVQPENNDTDQSETVVC